MEALRQNVEIHDRIARRYEERHREIFNPIEQLRLESALKSAFRLVATESQRRRALDFGCGSGNLTRHLLALGAEVVAADVSTNFLDLVAGRFRTPCLTTHVLNGQDLGEFADESFEFVAAYSVLHHIPDYLGAVRELARVCKVGGVILLDHEPTEGFWRGDAIYRRFIAEASRTDWRKFLVLGNYVGKVRRWFNPRYANEGDIHVWPDDHVEWPAVERVLTDAGCTTILREDYLLYKSNYRQEVYERYANSCTDTRCLVSRKTAPPSAETRD
jgi:ubiquinone/menaquinone biosynthesis C-methylase UbiE